MTLSPKPSSRNLRARAGVAVALVGTVIGISTTGEVGAATLQSSSEVIATEAARALDALEHWQATEHPANYVQFVQSRELTATMVADALELDPAALETEWAETSVQKQHSMLAAITQLGVPYRSMRSEEGVGFDCSGLTTYAFARAGVDLPRISGDQIRNAESVEAEAAEPGDLVYYPGHVSIYIGLDAMVHSPNSGNHVEVRTIPERSLRYGDATQTDG